MLGERALLEGFKIFRFFNNLKMYIVGHITFWMKLNMDMFRVTSTRVEYI